MFQTTNQTSVETSNRLLIGSNHPVDHTVTGASWRGGPGGGKVATTEDLGVDDSGGEIWKKHMTIYVYTHTYIYISQVSCL